jgi:hypothetical protein
VRQELLKPLLTSCVTHYVLAGFIAWNTVQAISSYVRGVLSSHAVFKGVGVGSQVRCVQPKQQQAVHTSSRCQSCRYCSSFVAANDSTQANLTLTTTSLAAAVNHVCKRVLVVH